MLPRWQDGGWPLADCTGLQFGPDAALDRVTMLGVAQATLRSSAGRWILPADGMFGVVVAWSMARAAAARRPRDVGFFACDSLYE